MVGAEGHGQAVRSCRAGSRAARGDLRFCFQLLGCVGVRKGGSRRAGEGAPRRGYGRGGGRAGRGAAGAVPARINYLRHSGRCFPQPSGGAGGAAGGAAAREGGRKGEEREEHGRRKGGKRARWAPRRRGSAAQAPAAARLHGAAASFLNFFFPLFIFFSPPLCGRAPPFWFMEKKKMVTQVRLAGGLGCRCRGACLPGFVWAGSRVPGAVRSGVAGSGAAPPPPPGADEVPRRPRPALGREGAPSRRAPGLGALGKGFLQSPCPEQPHSAL